MRFLYLTTALIMSAGAAQASSFDASASIDIKIKSIDLISGPGGELTYLDLFAADFFTDSIVSGSGTASFATTTTTTPADPSSVTSPSVGEGTTQVSEVEGDASFPDFAAAIAATDGDIEIENTSLDGSVISLTFTAIFDLTVEAISTALGDFVDATADVGIDLITDGDLVDPDGFFDIAGPSVYEFYTDLDVFAEDSTATDAESDIFEFTVTLDPGESLDIFSLADTFGAVNGALIPSIPVGPAAPLLLGGLATLGFLRRKSV